MDAECNADYRQFNRHVLYLHPTFEKGKAARCISNVGRAKPRVSPKIAGFPKEQPEEVGTDSERPLRNAHIYQIPSFAFLTVFP